MVQVVEENNLESDRQNLPLIISPVRKGLLMVTQFMFYFSLL